MVDGVDVTNSGVSPQETTTSPVVENTQAESNANATPAISESKKTERVYTKDELAKITNAEKNKAVDKARREWEAAQALANNSQPVASPNIPTSQPVETPQLPTVAPEQFRHMVQQEIATQAQQQAQEMFFQRSISEFSSKIEDAKTRYPDYQEVVNTLGLDKMPEPALKSMVSLLNVAENGGDVLYDVAKNPTKYAGIINLVGINPNLAIAEIQRLSHSIKENEKATKTPIANPPLSQINPSTTGTDNGVMTLKDMKRQPWARG